MVGESLILYPMIVPPPRTESEGAVHCRFKDESPLVTLILLGAPVVVIGVAVMAEKAP